MITILEKLKEELEKIKSEYRSKKTGKRPGVMTLDDKFLEARANEIDVVLLLITSIEKSETDIDHNQVKENIRVMDEQDGNVELLPEFKAYPEKQPGEIYLKDRYAEQIELLTDSLNQLIKANKK